MRNDRQHEHQMLRQTASPLGFSDEQRLQPQRRAGAPPQARKPISVNVTDEI
jgi:hypothetical protein